MQDTFSRTMIDGAPQKIEQLGSTSEQELVQREAQNSSSRLRTAILRIVPSDTDHGMKNAYITNSAAGTKRSVPESEQPVEIERRSMDSDVTFGQQEGNATTTSDLLNGLTDQTIKNTVERVIRHAKDIKMESKAKFHTRELLQNFFDAEDLSILKMEMVAAVKGRVNPTALEVPGEDFTATLKAFEKEVNDKIIESLADQARDKIMRRLKTQLTLPEEEW